MTQTITKIRVECEDEGLQLVSADRTRPELLVTIPWPAVLYGPNEPDYDDLTNDLFIAVEASLATLNLEPVVPTAAANAIYTAIAPGPGGEQWKHSRTFSVLQVKNQHSRVWFSPHGTEWEAETYEEALEMERDSLVEQLEAARKERSDAVEVAARAMDRSQGLQEQLEVAHDKSLENWHAAEAAQSER